jgi:hypothetical protein
VAAVRLENPYVVFINMDQTAVQSESRSRTMIEIRGADALPTSANGDSTALMTVALTVTPEGEKLAPYLVYKGSPTGRIRREISQCPEFPASLIYAVQSPCWMDETLIIDWIERSAYFLTSRTLRPYVSRQNPNNLCLVLDSMAAHRTACVSDVIEQIWIKKIIMPGGLTGYLQPLDVAINSPFKH